VDHLRYVGPNPWTCQKSPSLANALSRSTTASFTSTAMVANSAAHSSGGPASRTGTACVERVAKVAFRATRLSSPAGVSRSNSRSRSTRLRLTFSAIRPVKWPNSRSRYEVAVSRMIAFCTYAAARRRLAGREPKLLSRKNGSTRRGPCRRTVDRRVRRAPTATGDRKSPQVWCAF
jgi:hypothetical protein